MWIEINNKLINLEHVKEIYVNTSQFGGKRLCIDGASYDVKDADMLYRYIKNELYKMYRLGRSNGITTWEGKER